MNDEWLLAHASPPKRGEIEFWTKMSLYTLVYIHRAEDGAADFGRVDACQRTYPKDYKPRRTANTG